MSSLNHIEIPTLLFWENGNSWYGSLGSTRFFIKPDGSEHQLTVQLWKGPLSMELSEIVATAVFPITEEGLSQTVTWLEERTKELESPKKATEA